MTTIAEPRRQLTAVADLIAAGLWLRRAAEAERDRWALWLAPLLGAGVLTYFALPVEPPAWLGPALLATVSAAAVAMRLRGWNVPLLVAAAAVVVGFAAGQMRTATTGTPILGRSMGPVMVTGQVVEVAPLPGRAGRMLLEVASIERLPPAQTPRLIRIRVSGDIALLEPGDRVAYLAELSPPPLPAAPGAFDYQRQAWFDGIGAIGFALGGPTLHEPAATWERGWWNWWTALRQDATRRIQTALPGPEGAMAAALMTGYQDAIPADIVAAMRDSGLAHLLSISGLHIGMVSAILFVGLRAGLALIPWLALRTPIKKWAAAAAFAGTAGYVLLAGATVPTLRSFAMSAIVLLAVLVDRSPLSMRLVAWAAAAILLLRPEALLGASFQMSFAAVAALIAMNEGGGMARFTGPPRGGRLRRFARATGAVAITSFVAGTATTPLVAYHFHRIADYGVLANMAAIPLSSIWVMPLAVVAFLLMPFGLERWALIPMGWGIWAIIAIARWVAALPGAAVRVPAVPAAAVLVLVGGGLWLGIWRGRWRWLGLLVLPLAALILLFAGRPPDLLIDAEGMFAAIRDESGVLRFSQTRRGGIVADTWLERNAQARRAPWPSDPGGCDAQGCVAELRGRRVAVAGTLSAALEDCGHSDLVIAFRPLPAWRCRGSVLIGGRDLWHQGALALWIEKEGVRIETVRRSRGARAWVPDRPAEGEGPKWMAWPRSAAGALNTADKAQPADPEP